MQQATLETKRLRMRPLRITDASRVRELAGDIRVAEMTALIPHPYPEIAAEEWVEKRTGGTDQAFAVADLGTDVLVGAIGIHPEPNGLATEIGFWIGVPFWGRGYCTEAAREILRHCFEDLGFQRVYAGHFAGNDASGRVQQKIGMRPEGVQRWGVFRFGEPKDRVMYGIIRPDWEERQA
jgi:RimJ/RimL family protein N-acetyltransferase